jgi:modulator of FtsH protease
MQSPYNASGFNTSVAFGAERNKVLRNTYMMLGLTMIPTVLGALAGIQLNLLPFAMQHPLMFGLGSFAVMMGMFFGISAGRNSGLGVVLLLLLTGFMGVMLGPILQVALGLRNGGELIALAAGGTGGIFLTLAGVATVTKRDFGFLGKFLMIGLVLLILASFANMFFHIPALALALSTIAVLIFSALILYDVSRVVNGGETNYVMATLAIYLDIYNLFLNLLQLLMAFMGQRE